jgi:serine/threonine-protein kinase
MIRLRAMETERSPAPGARSPEEIVMSTAGIRSVQDVLATMREQELRGQEASQHELPYVPPEVLMGGAPSVRADVFTIGVLAYQMVTGRAPFQAPSMPELIGQMLQVKPAAPITLNASVPAAASEAILRAIDSAPVNRFESAESFSNAISV